MNMTATILRVNARSLLVRDEQTGQEVLVNYRNPRRFRPGERIRIRFSGAMTSSIPPQISASSIQRLSGPAPQPGRPIPIPPRPVAPAPGPSEMRASILQVGRNFLLVRNNANGQQMRVNYAFAHHFCPRQQVRVRYDTITLQNPPLLTATDIFPLC